MTPATRGQAEPVFIGSDIYRGSSYGAAHPLRVPRVSTVIDLSRAMGWLAPGKYLPSPRAKPAALCVWHDPAYIAALQRAEQACEVDAATRRQFGLGTLSNPVFADMFRRPATGAGGVMLAAELLAQRPGAIYVPGGGTHHGMPGYANGFCYLNDPVLGILTLCRAGIARVAYVDIDAHHPDGVEHAFAGDPDILMISVHEEARWPFTGLLSDAGVGNCYNLPVPAGFNDTEMRRVLEDLILPRIKAFGPQAIVLQCGADALLEDPLSRLALSNNAHWAVVAALRDLAPRFMVLGGGGYNPWSVGRCWAGVWATLSDQTIPDVLPDAAQSILRALDWGGGGRRSPDSTMMTTLRDPPREGPVRAEVATRLAVLSGR